MSEKSKTLEVQIAEHWIGHLEENNLEQNDGILWTGVTLNNPKTEPHASKLLCLLSPRKKRDNLLDHNELLEALQNEKLRQRVFSYGIECTLGGHNIVK